MNKIKISETGEVDIKSVENLSKDELKQWIECRLHGKDIQAPMDFRQGDSPYYIISLLYPKLNRSVREDIRDIILDFVKEMARNEKSHWTEEAGHQLLLLVNSLHLDEAAGFLVEMAESKRFFEKDALSLMENLHYRILQTIVALDYRNLRPEFWYEQIRLASNRSDKYIGVAFDGLTLISLRYAIHLLTEINGDEAEDLVFASFPYLVDKYDINRVAPLVEEYLPKMKPTVRATIQSFFADEGYPLKYQEKPDYAGIRNVLKDLLYTLTGENIYNLQTQCARI